MPLFQARKALLVKTRLAIDETIKSILDLAAYWPLQERNAFGPELIADGDMETVGIAAWTDGDDAVLTKETSDPYEGLQSLRVTRDGTDDPYAAQTMLVVGKRYLVNARAKSDGNAIPRVLDTGVLLATGTADTFYQEFDFEFIATTTEIRFESQTSTGVQYTEWDAISVVELISEGGGSVAYAINPQKLLGRDELTPKDWTVTPWNDVAGATVVDLDTFTSVSTGGMKHPNMTGVSREYIARLKGDTTASKVEFLAFDLSTIYKDLGTGAFDETFTFTSTDDGTYIRNTGAGTTNIDWSVSYIQQTDIAKSGDFPGVEELVDGDMEAVGVGAWAVFNNATLTKETGTRTGGSGTQVFRVARDGGSDPAGTQTILTIGKRYRVTGWARSDGNAIPEVRGDDSGEDNLWEGIVSTDWQLFDFEFVNTASVDIYLQAITATGTEYCEFDDVSVTEANPLNGDSVAVIIGQLAGLLGLAYLFDGIVAYINLLSAELNSILNPESGGVGGFIHVNSAAWTDGLSRYFLYFFVDSDNFIGISKSTVDNSLFIQVKMGGLDRSATVDVNGPDQFIHVFVTWTQAEIVILVDGYVVATLLGAGDWIGNLTIALVAAKSTAPVEPFYGYACHISLYSSAPSIYDVKKIAESGGIISPPTTIVTGASGFSSGFSSGFE